MLVDEYIKAEQELQELRHLTERISHNNNIISDPNNTVQEAFSNVFENLVKKSRRICELKPAGTYSWQRASVLLLTKDGIKKGDAGASRSFYPAKPGHLVQHRAKLVAGLKKILPKEKQYITKAVDTFLKNYQELAEQRIPSSLTKVSFDVIDPCGKLEYDDERPGVRTIHINEVTITDEVELDGTCGQKHVDDYLNPRDHENAVILQQCLPHIMPLVRKQAEVSQQKADKVIKQIDKMIEPLQPIITAKNI